MSNLIPYQLKLPEWAQNWTSLCEKIGDAVGKIIVYKKVTDDKWMLDSNAIPVVDRIQSSFTRDNVSWYSIREFSKWYSRWLITPSWQSEAYYLVHVVPSNNITVLWSEMVGCNPWLKHLYDRTSLLSLHSYLAPLTSIEIPDMDPPLYIAPVLPNSHVMIETAPHLDGFGAESSYHLCLFGAGHNNVFFWKPVLEQEGNEDFLLCERQMLHKQLGIPVKPTLPHDSNYTFSVNQDAWSTIVQQDSPVHRYFLKHVKLSGGNILLLPAAYPHMFTKVKIFFSFF